MTVLETERLVLSRLSYDDCDFIVELLNEPAFQRYIGDKAVRSRADARAYLHKGPIGSYERHGFGMFLVRSRSDNAPMGMCGLVKRKEFDAPDVGLHSCAGSGPADMLPSPRPPCLNTERMFCNCRVLSPWLIRRTRRPSGWLKSSV